MKLALGVWIGLFLVACAATGPAPPHAVTSAAPAPGPVASPGLLHADSAAKEAAPVDEHADQPSPRQVEHSWMSLSEWRQRHQAQLANPGRATAQVVFLGNSITQGWSGSEAYQRYFADCHPLNLGIGGDQTQHVLWRIDDGALKDLRAKVVVVMIGVNNLGNGFSPEETLDGVVAVVKRVTQELPSARVLLLGILPAGETKDDPLRRSIERTNELLGSHEFPASVEWHDVGATFVESDGRLSRQIMGDLLHPTAVGYERLSAVVAPLVQQLLASKRGGSLSAR